MASQLLSLRALNRATLSRQLLLERAELPVRLAVERLASLQAQHPDWPRVALWSRVQGHGPTDLAEAVRRRMVVRATLMRTTLHIVAAADYWPLASVTLPGRQDQFRLYYREAATDERVMNGLRPAHEAALAALAERPRQLAELRTILGAAVPARVARDGHYLWRHFAATVPLVDVPGPDGEARYGRSWYAAAADWLGPAPAGPSKPHEAAATLVERYLAAYGPASRDDLVSWAGRRISHLRDGLARLERRLMRFRDEAGRELLDLADAPRPAAATPVPPRFLARWDSLLLAHQPKFRTRVLPGEHHAIVNRRNGDVLPTFLLDGFVSGTWAYEPASRTAGPALVLSPARRLAAGERAQLVGEALPLAAFIDPDEEAEIRIRDG